MCVMYGMNDLTKGFVQRRVTQTKSVMQDLRVRRDAASLSVIDNAKRTQFGYTTPVVKSSHKRQYVHKPVLRVNV